MTVSETYLTLAAIKPPPPPAPPSPLSAKFELSFFDDDDEDPPEVDSVVEDAVGLVLLGCCSACAVFEVISGHANRPARPAPYVMYASVSAATTLSRLGKDSLFNARSGSQTGAD